MTAPVAPWLNSVKSGALFYFLTVSDPLPPLFGALETTHAHACFYLLRKVSCGFFCMELLTK